MKKTLTFGLVVAAGSAAIPTQAQETQDTMVVVGSRTPVQISEIPGAVWVVPEKEIQQQIRTGQSLKSALGKLIPGFDFGSSTNRTSYAQNFRGRDALIMINGVSLNGSRSLSRQFDSIDPFNIARIEVLSGASSLYGGGATGGIINIVTKKGEVGGPYFETELGLTTGFNDSDDLDKKAAQSISGGNEKVQGRLAVAVQENGWFYDAEGDIIKPDIAQTGLQGNRSIDVMGSLGFNLSDTERLDFTAQYYNSSFEGDKGLYYPNYAAGTTYSERIQNSEVREGYDSDVDPETDRIYLNANYHNRSLLGQDFYFQAYHREESSVFNPFPYNASIFTASEQNTDLTGAKAAFTAQVTEPFSVTYGIDVSREDFDAKRYNLAISEGGLELDQVSILDPYYPSFEADTYAGFVQGDYQLTPQLMLSGGARVEKTDVEVGPQGGNDGGSNEYDVSLFNAKALYDFENGQQTWLAYTQGFEIPDIAKAYRGQSFDISANPVDGIKTEQLEAGWRLATGNWQTQIAAYYSWSDKAIDYLYSNDGEIEIGVTTIDKDVRTYGLEGKVERFIGNNWTIGSNFNLVKSEEKVDGEWVDASVTEASLPTATLFGEWSDIDTRARLQASRAFGIDDSAGNEIDGFTTVDAIASQDTRFGTFSFGIENLLDEEYVTIWGQRAAVFYEAYGAESLWDLQGRGRTYSLTWSHQY